MNCGAVVGIDSLFHAWKVGKTARVAFLEDLYCTVIKSEGKSLVTVVRAGAATSELRF